MGVSEEVRARHGAAVPEVQVELEFVQERTALRSTTPISNSLRTPLKDLIMAELKTKPTDASVAKFLNKVPDEARREDCVAIARLMEEITGSKPKMWGERLVGFGEYHYKYASGREGDWPITGFSPGKQE